eukprot:gene10273-12153_t
MSNSMNRRLLTGQGTFMKTTGEQSSCEELGSGCVAIASKSECKDAGKELDIKSGVWDETEDGWPPGCWVTLSGQPPKVRYVRIEAIHEWDPRQRFVEQLHVMICAAMHSPRAMWLSPDAKPILIRLNPLYAAEGRTSAEGKGPEARGESAQTISNTVIYSAVPSAPAVDGQESSAGAVLEGCQCEGPPSKVVLAEEEQSTPPVTPGSSQRSPKHSLCRGGTLIRWSTPAKNFSEAIDAGDVRDEVGNEDGPLRIGEFIARYGVLFANVQGGKPVTLQVALRDWYPKNYLRFQEAFTQAMPRWWRPFPRSASQLLLSDIGVYYQVLKQALNIFSAVLLGVFAVPCACEEGEIGEQYWACTWPQTAILISGFMFQLCFLLIIKPLASRSHQLTEMIACCCNMGIVCAVQLTWYLEATSTLRRTLSHSLFYLQGISVCSQVVGSWHYYYRLASLALRITFAKRKERIAAPEDIAVPAIEMQAIATISNRDEITEGEPEQTLENRSKVFVNPIFQILMKASALQSSAKC